MLVFVWTQLFEKKGAHLECKVYIPDQTAGKGPIAPDYWSH